MSSEALPVVIVHLHNSGIHNITRSIPVQLTQYKKWHRIHRQSQGMLIRRTRKARQGGVDDQGS